MGLRKIAVDPTAEKYWKDYFEELGYGEDLVRKLPRRVASAFEKRLAETNGLHCVSAEVIPHSCRVEKGKALFEGTFAAQAARRVGSKEHVPVVRTFRATLDRRGRIERMKVL
jgi:hypothetical protein